MTKICANCKSRCREADKYCRFCGSSVNKAEYKEDRISMLYGPPYEAKHKCQNESCGYEWEVRGLGKDEVKWCPECGSPAPELKDSDSDCELTEREKFLLKTILEKKKKNN